MTKSNFFTKAAIDGFTPHINNFFVDQFKLAEQEIKKSDEYTALKEEYLTTKEYDKLVSDVSEDAPEKFLNYITYLVENVYNKETTKLNDFIAGMIEGSWEIRGELNLHLQGIYNVIRPLRNGELKCTTKTYISIVEDIIEQGLDNNIEYAQENYARRHLILRTYPTHIHWDNLHAVLNTTTVGSTKDVEQAVLNNFDFVKMVKTV